MDKIWWFILLLLLWGAHPCIAKDDSNFAWDMVDPMIIVKPHKWLTPAGMLNPNNPVFKDRED